MLQVGIIGAGVAGLLAAIALLQAGHQVEIFEKSRSRNETGATIVIGPNGTNILSHWSFDFDEAGAVDCNRVSSIPSDIHDLDPEERKRYGDRWCFFCRARLHAGLRAVVERRWPDVKIQLGEAVSDVDVEAGIIHFMSGTKIRKDLVVIADRSHRKLITKILERPISVSTSYVSLHRFSQPVEMVQGHPKPGKPADTQTPALTFPYKAEVRRPDHVFNAYPCRGGELLEISHIKQIHPGVQSIHEETQCAKMDTNVSQALIETFKGKVIAIGNAAHLVSPMHGQGTCMALEDAAALETLFTNITTSE